MNKDQFIAALEVNGVLNAKRCTESYLTKNNLIHVLDELVSPDFGTVGERIKHVKYGGGYCKVCGVRTAVSKNYGGFVEYCKEHFHEPKKGKAAHNRKEIPPKEELEELYFEKKLTLLEISKHYGNVSNVTVKKWFEHYGIKLLSHSEVIIERVQPKIQEQNLVKYGEKHFFATEEGKAKVSAAFIKKYGVHYHPIDNPSMAEDEVRAFFDSFDLGFNKNRKVIGMEIDGYNENLKVGFEYCGLFYHTEKRKPPALHYQKYKKCEENGIRLFTIFSNEWTQRKQQVKAFIRSALGYYDVKLFARNLEVQIRDNRDLQCIEFMNETHIQGAPNIMTTNAYYCLVDKNNDVLCAISIGKHPRNNKISCITRMATKEGHMIVGGSKRLLKYIMKDCDYIKTWSDNRWTNGDAYARLGFTLVEESRQDYYYTDAKNLIPKQKMTKSKMGTPEGMTEKEYAESLGYSRIWDCGKKTWELHKKDFK